MSANQPSSQLSLRGIEKTYGGVKALRGVDFHISRAGVIHGLIGANGSGKSTLLGVLSGQVVADAGSMELEGMGVQFRNPAHALAHGIAMVSQESALAADLSIAENILLGRRATRRIWGIDWKDTRRRAKEVLARLELDYDPAMPVSRLRPDQRQMVEIARSLSMETSVLILDEPTSSLSDDQVSSLFAAVNRLRDQGVSTIFVSHRLPEMFALCEEFTVLRDGRSVASGDVNSFTHSSLVDAMVGGTNERVSASKTKRPEEGRTTRLKLSGLTSGRQFANVDLDVREGEIVGLAGLAGAGRGELLESVFGMRSLDGGEMFVNGVAHRPSHPQQAIRAGIGYVPPDRKVDGAVLQCSILENLSMVATLKRNRLGPFRRYDLVRAREIAARMRIVAPHLGAPVVTLSGGNQQKVVIGKWLGIDRTVLLLDEPTRGVDIAAKEEIHSLLREAASEGISMLVSSSETDELIRLCDRILVMHSGRIVAEFGANEASESTITRLAGGHV